MKRIIIWIVAVAAYDNHLRYVDKRIIIKPQTLSDSVNHGNGYVNESMMINLNDIKTASNSSTKANDNSKQFPAADMDNKEINTPPNVYPITIPDNNIEINATDLTLGPDGTTNSDAIPSSLENVSIRTRSAEKSAEILNLYEVKTEHGVVGGQKWQETSDIISYLDIPYGKFNKHFEVPLKPESWEDIHMVAEHNKRCPQMDNETFIGSLDCLTLSVFRPLNAQNASVLFYIHDGNFKTGSGNPAIYGPDYLVPKNIILVLPNYRLGPLGFLCLLNETAPGNAGLKDLALALQWTKNNIRAFGGDPSKIIVGGDGTAGALAGYLALSLRTKEYVSKVITDSGSLLSHWAIDRNPVDTSMKLAEHIGNIMQINKSPYDLFQDINAEDLIKHSNKFDFKPCIEENVTESFITSTPWKILQDEKVTVPFLIGTASHAGLQEALQYDDELLSQLNENFTISMPHDLAFTSNSQKIDVSESLKRQYFGVQNITENQIEQLSLYITDASYQVPGLRLARALLNAGAVVYLYEFSYVGSLNKELLAIEGAPKHGAVRGDIVGYLFTQDGRVVSTDNDEQRIVNLMTNLWTSFTATGTPTADGINWHKLDVTKDTDEQWLSINTNITSQKGLHIDRLRLWTEIYDKYFIERNLASWAEVNRLLAFAFLCMLYMTLHGELYYS